MRIPDYIAISVLIVSVLWFAGMYFFVKSTMLRFEPRNKFASKALRFSIGLAAHTKTFGLGLWITLAQRY